jgi:small subunit ribosomal protein S21
MSHHTESLVGGGESNDKRAGRRPITGRMAAGIAPVTQAMKVERREGETVEQLLRRFNKGVVAERITKTYREKMHFVSKSEQAKEKRRRAERNRRKKAMQSH